MYQAPDFVKVSVSVKDVYATYNCVMSNYGYWNHINPCEGKPDAIYETNTYVGMGLGYQCWTGNMG